MFTFGANGSTESSIIKTVFKSERKQIICHCGTLLDVPLDPAPFNCTSDYCSGRYIHDKDRRIFKIQNKKLFSIITA
ncbi:hypothetical protein KKD04_01120 [Patescibacteria group bacterium]|nr:hypothetical protein [Patescibacteria group bacterium]